MNKKLYRQTVRSINSTLGHNIVQFCTTDRKFTEKKSNEKEIKVDPVNMSHATREERKIRKQGEREKQGRIHGYRSHVRWTGAVIKKGYLSDWAGAVTQKQPVNAKKS